jgi:hypothetical protein
MSKKTTIGGHVDGSFSAEKWSTKVRDALKKIGACYGRNIQADAVDEIGDELHRHPLAIDHVVATCRSTPNLPSNLYGFIADTIEHRNRSISIAETNALHQSNSWHAEPYLVTAEEWAAFSACSLACITMVSYGIETRNGNAWEPPESCPDIIMAWRDAGRPKTWCESHDALLHTMDRFYDTAQLATALKRLLVMFQEKIKGQKIFERT